jgi:FtsZ-binding cell division protein ZapB
MKRKSTRSSNVSKNLTAVLVLLLLPTSINFAQDDIAKKLIDAQERILTIKDEVAKLKEANNILSVENAKLKEAIEHLKTNGTKKSAPAKAKLDDIFVVGAVFTSKSEHIGGPTRGTTGSGIVTITSRDGDSFTATNTWVIDQDKTNGTSEIKGRIVDANTAKWKRVDGPIPSETKATLRPDGLYIDVLNKNAKGMVIKGVWRVP